ncbi:hypothetical protein ACSLO9_34215, partial [Escherichia coli]
GGVVFCSSVVDCLQSRNDFSQWLLPIHLDDLRFGHKIGVAYLVNRDKVTTVFQTYRKGVDDITESDL